MNQKETQPLSHLKFPQNRYHLEIASCPSLLDVVQFTGREGLSQTYRYEVMFTSVDKDIAAVTLLRQPARLMMSEGPLSSVTGQKVVHGVITDFRRLSSSADEAHYQLTLEPFLSLLDKQFRTHRFFVNQSVVEVVTQILTEHGFAGWESVFTLKQVYPKREQINQYEESDLRFIERLLSEVGIFYFFSVQADTQSEVVHFADKQSAYLFGKRLRLNSPSGMSDSGEVSAWGVGIQHKVVESRVVSQDYNHREAQKVLQSPVTDLSGSEMTYGEVYHYKARHLSRGNKVTPEAESAIFMARLDHERFLSHQVLISGATNDASVCPGHVLMLEGDTPQSLENGTVITQTEWSGSRHQALRVQWQGTAYSENLCWRPALLARPKISGTLMARVTSAKAHDIYAWQNASGLYRVKFDADRDEKKAGYESMWLRLAKPYGGDIYGFHFPLIAGTEVAIGFHDGDVDRPYIAHALHDSRHNDVVTEKNSTRNVLRTAGHNKLRMEDKRGEEHIKLSTEYGGKTQLNLGHNVDVERKRRGEGAELRTDDWVAIRGGKGIYLTADKQPKGNDQMLEMDKAIAQLESALSLAKSLARAVETAGGTQGDNGSQTQLKRVLEKLSGAGIVMNAPEGIAIVSPKAVRVSSGGESIGLVSGHNTDIGAGKDVTVAAGSEVSVYSQGELKLLSGKGKVMLQAQDNALEGIARKDLTLSSTEGRMVLSADKELVLTCEGAYIKLKGGQIELGAPKNIILKAMNVQKMRAADYDIDTPELPRGHAGKFMSIDEETGEILPFTAYQITTGNGDIFKGVTDETGNTTEIYTPLPESMKIEYQDSRHDEQLMAINDATGEVITNYAYYAVAENGLIFSGFTDNNGLTERMVTGDECMIEVYWGAEALSKMEDKNNA